MSLFDVTTIVLHIGFTRMSLLDVTTIILHMELKVDV